MECALRPGTGHTVPDAEPRIGVVDLDDHSRRAVAEGRRCLESIALGHPGVRAVSSTFRTWSGRAQAFCSRFMRACSTFILSVPMLMTECVVLTRTPPEGGWGIGTSCNSSRPS